MPRKSSHCISTRRNPFHGGARASVPMEISAFHDRARLYGSFRGAPPTRKFSYVPFTRRHLRRARVSLSLSLFRSRSLRMDPEDPFPRPPSLSLHLDGPPTRPGTSKRSFAARDTRVNIHAPAVVAFRCIFTPESSLPRCIFIRRE